LGVKFWVFTQIIFLNLRSKYERNGGTLQGGGGIQPSKSDTVKCIINWSSLVGCSGVIYAVFVNS
jgi:hypothetical protein